MQERPDRNWIRIALSEAEINFNDRHIAEVQADGKTICVGRYKNELFAFAQKCPHASGYFIGGYIDALGNVVCPLHRYRFSIKTGRNSSLEGYYLKHWPVEIRDDGVYVGLDIQKGWSLFA